MALIVVAVALAVAGCDDSDDSGSPPAQTPAPKQERAGGGRPSFVVVLTDDQEPASLRVMRETRRLLGREGVTFTSAYASAPECCPSRASLLTGQYVHNHGVLSNQPPDGGVDAFADENTLPVWLEDAGYRTGYIGKYLNGYGWEALGNDPEYVPPGWSEWAALNNHTEYQMYGYSLNENGGTVTYGDSPADYQTDVLGEKAARFITQSSRANAPFFLTVAPLAPHDEGVLEDEDVPRNPRPAPRHEGRFDDLELPRDPSFNEADIEDKPRFIKRDPRLTPAEVGDLEVLYRSRMESLLAVDEMVGDLVDRLRRLGELGDTVFVFTSDNGYLLGQHRATGKESPYEEAARVPLVIRGPGFDPGRVEETPVSNVDLVATVVEQSGVRPGLAQDGVSLATDDLAGERGPVLFELPQGRAFSAVRDGQYVLAEFTEGGAELYDLKRDPYELENVKNDPDYGRAKQRLSERLSQLQGCSGKSCR